MTAVDAAREAARHEDGRFGEQTLTDPGAAVLDGPDLPGQPIIDLPEPDRYEQVLRAIAELDKQRLLDTFDVTTVEEAVAAGRQMLAEAGEPGRPGGYVLFGEELDMVTAADPYPLVRCGDLWPTAPERRDGELVDARQVGCALSLPPRTWKVDSGRYLTLTPLFYTTAELVTVDPDGVERCEMLAGEDDAARWERELAGRDDRSQRVRFRSVHELRVDAHEAPDVSEGATDTLFDWSDSSLVTWNRLAAGADLFEFASNFTWDSVSSGRWATELIR